MERAAPKPRTKGKMTSSEPGLSRAPSPPLPEILGRPLRITADPHTNADEAWARVREAMVDTFQNKVTRARAVDQARLDEGWALLLQATERCRLLDQRVAKRRERVRKEAEEIHVSVADEAEEVLTRARASAREILARAHNEATEIISSMRHRIPTTVGPSNPTLAGQEAKRAAQHLLDQAKTNADGLLANARQRLEEAEDREALLHAREESADSRVESLSLQEAGIAAREAEVRRREQELRLQEEQLSALEDQLNREQEALESREEMVNQANTDLAQHQEMLQQRESSLQERMDHMLNQRRVSLEQKFERKRAENLEACHTDFRSKTDTTSERYKQGREALERQVRDLEADLRKAHKVRRGAEHALEETDAMMNVLQRDISRLEEENEVMVQQIVEEARVLRSQYMRMFCEFSARLMEATRRLGIDGLNLPSLSEDDGSILHFFGQLSDKLAEAATKVMELTDTECRELLGLAGTQIFSNIQRLRPDLDLEEVLQRRAATPPGTPNRMA
jgi:chromosome segregation ATPase